MRVNKSKQRRVVPFIKSPEFSTQVNPELAVGGIPLSHEFSSTGHGVTHEKLENFYTLIHIKGGCKSIAASPSEVGGMA